MECSALILTGGSGNRVKGLSYPKQFYEILDKPVFVHCLQTYESIEEVTDIYLIINQDFSDKYNDILSRFNFCKLKKLIPGGPNRQDSVENGINAIQDTDFVILQDGVSPTTHPELIKDCLETAKTTGVSSACGSSWHTVVTKSNGKIKDVLERKSLAYINSPQVYRLDWIKKALEFARKSNLTSRPTLELMNLISHPATLVASEHDNIKITTDLDLLVAEEVLKGRKQCQTLV